MSVSAPAQSPIASTVPTLTEDPFAQTVIRRAVGRLLRCPEFAPHESEDLHQELQAQLDRAMRSHDATIGHRNPFITMVVNRAATNLRAYRLHKIRDDREVTSLNVMVESGGERRELIQCISEDDNRNRIETAKLTDTELVDLRHDLTVAIATLPEHWQRLLKLRTDHSLRECSQIMDVPLSTLKYWLAKIAVVFREQGLHEYLV
jgi:RNA polymerase sigma factor (sigma-70 family)